MPALAVVAAVTAAVVGVVAREGPAIFFKFLTERHDDALLRKLWEHLEDGQGDPTEPADQANPTWLIQLDALLRREYRSTFAAEFAEFARWNLYLGTAADPAQAWDDARVWPQVTMNSVGAPYRLDAARLFYASTQYYFVPAAGRTSIAVALVDSELTTGNDLEGLVLWAAAGLRLWNEVCATPVRGSYVGQGPATPPALKEGFRT